MKTKFENLVCKISQKVLELESSYLVYWLMLRRSSPGKLLRTFSQISTKLLLFIAPAYSRVRYRSSNFRPSVRSFVRPCVRSSVNIYVEV